MTLSDFSSLLEKAKPKTIKGCPGFSARCPAHEDDSPSFAVWESPDGWLHVKCQKGCTETEILEALKLDESARRVHLNGYVHKDQSEKVYVYTDGDGDVLFEKVRYYKNGKKSFWQRIPNGDGTYTKDLSALGPMAKMLYRMPEVEDAIASGKRIFLNEGEKACDALAARGETATCQPGGAEKGSPASKWLAIHTEMLKGAAQIIVVQDQDETGREFAKYVVSELKKAKIPVRLVESKFRQEKADAFDHLAAGFTADEFIDPILVDPASLAKEAVEGGSLAQVKTEPKEFPLSDAGNAERMASLFGADIRYCAQWGKWLLWNGWKWEVCTDGGAPIYQRAIETVRGIQRGAWDCPDSDKRQAIGKWGFACESKSRIESMVSLCAKLPGIPVAAESLDKHRHLLNLANGTYDFLQGKLLPHDRDHLITCGISIAYDPDAKCPTWQNFLTRVLDGNADLLRYIWKAVGETLDGDVSEKCFFFLYGAKGDNGKSTFIETLMKLFGPYGKGVPTETLMTKFGDTGINNDIARLRDARLVAASETEDGKRINEGLIKKLTGGDTITARFLHQENFDFDPQFTVWMHGNHRPEIRGTDEAIWKRVKLIPFDVSIPLAEQNPNLKDDLKEEFPGILAWAIRGHAAWKEERLGEPEQIAAAVSQYRASQDRIGAFLDECIVEDPTERLAASTMYNLYQAWCKRTGEFSLTQRKFGDAMTERGTSSQKIGGISWYLGVKTPDKEAENDHVYRGGD